MKMKQFIVWYFPIIALILKVVNSSTTINWSNQIRIRSSFTGIEAIGMKISDLTGIDAFSSVVSFINLNSNQISSIKLLENFTLLDDLNLKNNQL